MIKKLQSEHTNARHIADELCRVYNIADFFEALAANGGAGWLVLEEYVSDGGDAYLNTVVSLAQPEHVRFHRPEDIIAAAGAAGYHLMEYQRAGLRHSVVIEGDKAALEKHISTLPDDVKARVAPEIDGDRLSVSLERGIFLWKSA